MAIKVYVGVTAEFSPLGDIVPVSFVWEDGRRYRIDRVTDVRPAASLKAGGAGYALHLPYSGQAVVPFS